MQDAHPCPNRADAGLDRLDDAAMPDLADAFAGDVAPVHDDVARLGRDHAHKALFLTVGVQDHRVRVQVLGGNAALNSRDVHRPTHRAAAIRADDAALMMCGNEALVVRIEPAGAEHIADRLVADLALHARDAHLGPI